jgi:hypothetical protein
MKENTYQRETQVIVSIITTVVLIGSYSLYIYTKYLAANPGMIEDLRFLGKAFLCFIPLAIIAQIIIHIIFAIVNKIVTDEEIPAISDERDKLIELKAIRISHWLFTIGFISAIATQALGMQAWIMLIILISSGFIAAIVSDIFRIYYYRRGF